MMAEESYQAAVLLALQALEDAKATNYRGAHLITINKYIQTLEDISHLASTKVCLPAASPCRPTL